MRCDFRLAFCKCRVYNYTAKYRKKIGGVKMSLFKERSDGELALRDLADKIARDIEGISANGVSDDLAPEARYASEMLGSSEEKGPKCGKP